jgi:hypothetical protein
MKKTLVDFYNFYPVKGEMRLGQQWCVHLRAMHPRMAMAIIGSDCDPFYEDDNLPRFFALVNDLWDTIKQDV